MTLLFFSSLLLFPYYVFAQNADSTTPGFRGGGAIAGALIAWWICRSRRHKPIGGWLLYYVFNVFVGIFVWLLFSVAAIKNYYPSSWADSTHYLLYLLTTLPNDIFTIAELILVFGLTIEKFRSWKVIERLRVVLALSIAFSILSILIDIRYYESQNVPLEVFGIIWPVVWLLYFLKSERVKSIYRDNDFITRFGIPYLEEKITGKTAIEEKEPVEAIRIEENKRCENCGIDYKVSAFPTGSDVCVVCQESINTENETDKEHETEDSSSRVKRVSLFSRVVNSLSSIVLIIGGILISIRLFLPPKYYLIKGFRLPYDGSRKLEPIADFHTALLHALGIAVITGVIFFVLRKRGNDVNSSYIKDHRQS